jgi:hypothetical protein
LIYPWSGHHSIQSACLKGANSANTGSRGHHRIETLLQQDFDDHRLDGYHSSSIHSLRIRGRALAYGDCSVRSGLRKVGVGCVGGGDVLGGFCSETFASTRFISSWLALSSPMAFELSTAICCWFALSCSMFRSRFARSRVIFSSNCVGSGRAGVAVGAASCGAV